MSSNETLGPLIATDNSIEAINDTFRQVREELDAIKGLRGAFTVHDIYQYKDTNGTILHGWGNITTA